MPVVHTQVTLEAAQGYEGPSVPQYLGRAAEVVASRMALAVGETVVDVGCGTGTVSRLLLDRVGATGRVVAVDVDADIVATGRRRLPEVEFRTADARKLPLRDRCAHAVLSVNALQFVTGVPHAIAEMARVARPRGRLGIGVWESLERNPWFEALAEAVDTVLGASAGAAVEAECSLGQPGELWALLAEARVMDVRVDCVRVPVHLTDVEATVAAHLEGSTLASSVLAAGPTAGAEIAAAVRRRLSPLLEAGPVPFHLAVATAQT